MAFMCLLLVFFLHKSLCAPSIEEINAALTGDKTYLEQQQQKNYDIDPDDVIQDPSEYRYIEEEKSGLITLLCNKKNDMMMNLGVLFLLLTVTR